MNTHLSAAARLTIAVFAVVTVVLFLVLGARFGGPTVSVAPVTEVHASVPDTQGLPSEADVLVRGVKVGRVTEVEGAGERARVTLALTDDAPPLRADAAIRIGAKTPLGEPFVDLDPGTEPAAHDSDAALPVRPAVELDEALGLLAPRTRADLRAVLAETGEGLADPEALAGTVASLELATGQLRRLGAVLRGQDGDVAETIESGRAVLEELAVHDADLRSLVADGTRTLRAGARRPAELREALNRLPAVLARARDTLDVAEPLLADAGPVVADVRTAAPPVTELLRDAAPAVADARALAARLPALRQAGLPALEDARKLLPAAGPALERLGPVLANVVPMVTYLAPRSQTIAAWFANTSALGQSGDAKGRWARFFVMLDPATALGAPGAPAGNSYTQPGDAAANQPYAAGDFPRLRALPRPD